MDYRGKIKKRRKLLGLTQEDVAKIIGITRTQYSYFESGRNNMPMERLLFLLQRLDLHLIVTEYYFEDIDLDNLNKTINRK